MRESKKSEGAATSAIHAWSLNTPRLGHCRIMMVAVAITKAAPVIQSNASIWLKTVGSKPISITPASATLIPSIRTAVIRSFRKMVASIAENGT